MTHDPQTAHRSDIQALRAIAVLAVIVCHMNPEWLPGGYLGVDIFFVISGFVITELISRQGVDFKFSSFWISRFFRIFPAYAFMLTFVALGAAIIFLTDNFSQFGESWARSVFFFSNQYFANYGDYFSPALAEQPLLHTWSLSVEMQFYLIYPVLLLFLLWLRKLWLFGVLVFTGFLLAHLYWIYSENTASLYYSLFIRVPEFILGGGCCS
jgi:peptidoglycan/LPS O-acetylase OafA/YrhL